MATNNKMVSCRNCQSMILAKAKTCPFCGVKNKKPFYKRWWFILLVIITLLNMKAAIGEYKEKRGEKFNWADMALHEMLPKPPSKRGEIHKNSKTELWIDIKKISEKQYNDYINACKDKGFTIDAELIGDSYDAYNQGGYKLSLYYYESWKEMHITLDPPMELSEIQWPNSELAKLIPAPESNIGKISWESSKELTIYIGKTPIADYNEYVRKCSDKGFCEDYRKGDDYYYAYNETGDYLSLNYEGNNIMHISLKKTDEIPDESQPVVSPATTPPEDESDQKTNPVNGIRPELKELLDTYETFFDDYIAFMKNYMESGDTFSMLADYMEYIEKYAEVMEKLDAIGEEDLSDAELKYYMEVMGRITTKLYDIL